MRRLLLPILIVLFGICVSCIPKEEKKPHWLTVTSVAVDGEIIRDTVWAKETDLYHTPIRFGLSNTFYFEADGLLRHRRDYSLGFEFESDTSFFYYNENCFPKDKKQDIWDKNWVPYYTRPEVSTKYFRFLPSDAPDISFSFEFEFTNMVKYNANDTIHSLKGRVDVGEWTAPALWGSQHNAYQKDLGPAKYLRYRE